ncbi:Homeobox protein goosecoid-2, partial [Geodia barretti]
MATAAAFTAAAGMPLRRPGTPSTADIFLPGAYPRALEPATVYHTLHWPYTMAIAKGSSFEGGEGAAASSKKPRTIFTPKQLLYLEEEFAKNQFPNMETRKKMAKTLDLTQQHIQVC